MNKHSAQLEILKLRELRPIDIATLYGPILRRRRHDELYSESLIQKRQYQSRFHPASFIAVRIIHIPGISIHMPRNMHLDHKMTVSEVRKYAEKRGISPSDAGTTAGEAGCEVIADTRP
jgi:hypothetical protein